MGKIASKKDRKRGTLAPELENKNQINLDNNYT